MSFKEALTKTKSTLSNVAEKTTNVGGNNHGNDSSHKATGPITKTNVLEKPAQTSQDGKVSDEDAKHIKNARKELTDAMHKATKDGAISATEIAEFKTLQKQLHITDTEMSEIKISVLKEVITKATADGKVTAEEMKVIEELQKGLSISSESIKTDLEKVKKMKVA